MVRPKETEGMALSHGLAQESEDMIQILAGWCQSSSEYVLD